MKLPIAIILVLVFSLNNAYADKSYEPGYLYDYTFTRLDNGMMVVLNPNVPTGNVAIRVGVRTGFYDYPYGKRQIPHFLEHLMFTGTSHYSETELENLVTDRGATWNGSTDDVMTIYEVDVYREDVDFGIDLLHHILTSSTLSDENIELSRNIIHQEYDGEPSWLRRFLYKNNIGRSIVDILMDYLYQEPHKSGEDLGWTGDITRDDVVDAYDKYYAPNNTIISIVGSFDPDDVLTSLNKSFGMWEKRSILSRKVKRFPSLDQDVELSSRFSPILGQRTKEIWLYLSVDEDHPHAAALEIAADYLNDRLYKRLRIETGLAYTPEVSSANFPEGGYFIMLPDVKLDDMQQAIRIWQEELDNLLNGKVDDEDVLKFRDAYLISSVREEWITGEISDFYTNSFDEWNKDGFLRKTHEDVEKVDMDTVVLAMREHIYNQPKLVLKDGPTLTYTQFFIILGILSILFGYGLWRLIIHYRINKWKKIK